MDRRTFIGGAAAGVLGLTAFGLLRQPQDDRTSNVIVIYMDDMRWDGLQFMPKTRELFDHEFTQARASGGACTDTRLCLFAGTFLQNAPWDWTTTGGVGHDASKTWGPWIQAAGYRTGMFGEYITTDIWEAGLEPGWDTWRSYYANAHHEYGYEIDPGASTDPVTTIAPEIGNLEYLMNELLSFSGGEEPFFASWAPQHPHTVTETGALHPRPEHANRWSSLNWDVPLDEDVTGKPDWVRELPRLTRDDVRDIQRAARGQARVLSGVDDEIARLFDDLDAVGVLDDTVIFFSSDQGVHYGEHRWGSAFDVPAAVQKQTMYDPVVRVPLLAHGPGFSAGRTTVPTSQVDITATVCAITGATPSQTLDGIDLRTIASDPGAFVDREILLGIEPIFTVSKAADGIVTGPDHSTHPLRKLIRDVDDFYELYDLDADPGELVNLVEDRPAEVAALEARLDTLLG